MGDDVVVAVEDSVREPVFSEELPDVFDGVEFGRPGRQGQEGDVARHDEVLREVPPGLVEDHDGMDAGSDHRADLAEMRLHGLGVAEGHDEACALALGRADRPEEIGPGGALVVGRPRPRAALRPAAGDLVLLPDPRLVLKPQLYPRAGGQVLADRRDSVRKAFLNWSAASGHCA